MAAWPHATENRACDSADGGIGGGVGDTGERRRTRPEVHPPEPGRAAPADRAGAGQRRLPRLRAGAGEPPDVPVRAAAALRAGRALAAVVRLSREARHHLHLRLPASRYSRPGVRGPVLRRAGAAGHAGTADRVPDAVQRPGQQRPRRRGQPPHRRAERREVAGRTTRRPASTPGATRSSSSTGTGARTSSSTSTPRPTSRTPTPGTTSASSGTAARSSPGAAPPPNDEENGLGSTRRVWFHDLSAGPESWTANWNVDEPDLDGNGVEDYRMPPIWEYTAGGYRAPGALTGDLAQDHPVRRAEPAVHHLAAVPGGAADVRAAEVDQPGQQHVRGLARRRRLRGSTSSRGCCVDELRELRWRNRLDYDNQDLPFEGEAEECYFAVHRDDERCYPELGYPPFANFFLQNTFELDRTQGRRRAGSTTSCRSSTTPSARACRRRRSGFADDNYLDGTQSYVFAFVSPEHRRGRLRPDHHADPRGRAPPRA